jgi:hypothetical protein
MRSNPIHKRAANALILLIGSAIILAACLAAMIHKLIH